MRFTLTAVGLCVVTQRIAGLDSVDQRAKYCVEVRYVLDVENFSASLIHHFANVYQAGNHAGSENRGLWVVSRDFQVVQDRIGGNQFGDDVVGALSAGGGADIIAD